MMNTKDRIVSIYNINKTRCLYSMRILTKNVFTAKFEPKVL